MSAHWVSAWDGTVCDGLAVVVEDGKCSACGEDFDDGATS